MARLAYQERSAIQNLDCKVPSNQGQFPMRLSLHRCTRDEKRFTRSLEHGGMRADATEMDLGNRLPEGAVQS